MAKKTPLPIIPIIRVNEKDLISPPSSPKYRSVEELALNTDQLLPLPPGGIPQKYGVIGHAVPADHQDQPDDTLPLQITRSLSEASVKEDEQARPELANTVRPVPKQLIPGNGLSIFEQRLATSLQSELEGQGNSSGERTLNYTESAHLVATSAHFREAMQAAMQRQAQATMQAAVQGQGQFGLESGSQSAEQGFSLPMHQYYGRHQYQGGQQDGKELLEWGYQFQYTGEMEYNSHLMNPIHRIHLNERRRQPFNMYGVIYQDINCSVEVLMIPRYATLQQICEFIGPCGRIRRIQFGPSMSGVTLKAEVVFTEVAGAHNLLARFNTSSVCFDGHEIGAIPGFTHIFMLPPVSAFHTRFLLASWVGNLGIDFFTIIENCGRKKPGAFLIDSKMSQCYGRMIDGGRMVWELHFSAIEGAQDWKEALEQDYGDKLTIIYAPDPCDPTEERFRLSDDGKNLIRREEDEGGNGKDVRTQF